MPWRARIKFLLAGAILAGAAGYLVAAGVQAGSVYFVDVDRFVSEGGHPGERARLNGKVSGELDARPADLIARFELLGTSGRVPVVFRGAISQQLQPGRLVVVEGSLDEHGVFQADVLLTKCASKYQGRTSPSGSGSEETP